MKTGKIFFLTVLLLMGAVATAGPARFKELVLSQPDGYTFTATFTGDEFYKIIKTKDDGFAVTRDSEGWWCYAYYEADGTKKSSGARVGTPASPEVLDASRQIPYSTLSHNARQKRSLGTDNTQAPILKRIVDKNGSMTKGVSIPAEKHGIVILAEYQDVKFTYERQDFENMLNTEGYNGTGSAMDYFNEQFQGIVNFSFDVSDIVTLPQNRAYYGTNDNVYGDDKNAGQMIYDACSLADGSIDFSKYDDDGDGYVDNVFVVFAGEDEADLSNEECIWAHAWYLNYALNGKTYRTGDGVTVDRYACASELTPVYTSAKVYTMELSGIGTFCHEYTHTLDLPDLYDTDYDDNGQSAALWIYTSLMDGGNMNNNGNTPPYYNCIERELIGLSEPEIAKGGEYTLEPIHKNGRYLKLPTETEDEYFLIECRSNEKWDQYIGGRGLLVYHIDKTDLKKWTYSNDLNANAAHQCADLIEADNRPDAFTTATNYYRYIYDREGLFFPSGSSTISSTTHSTFKTWGGSAVPCSIENITLNPDGSVTFTINTDIGLIAQATNVAATAFVEDAIIEWEADILLLDDKAYLTYKEQNSTNAKTIEVLPYSEKSYSCNIKGLKPDTTYEFEIVYKSPKGESGEVVKNSFTTLASSSTSYPYILISNNGVYQAGSKMPLRVINAQDASSIEWKVDDKDITISDDGLYYPDKGMHTLKAIVNYEGGAKDIITRLITIR